MKKNNHENENNDVNEGLKEELEAAKEKVAGLAKKLQSATGEVGNQAITYMKDHPVGALVGALAIGALLAKIIF